MHHDNQSSFVPLNWVKWICKGWLSSVAGKMHFHQRRTGQIKKKKKNQEGQLLIKTYTKHFKKSISIIIFPSAIWMSTQLKHRTGNLLLRPLCWWQKVQTDMYCIFSEAHAVFPRREIFKIAYEVFLHTKHNERCLTNFLNLSLKEQIQLYLIFYFNICKGLQ